MLSCPLSSVVVCHTQMLLESGYPFVLCLNAGVFFDISTICEGNNVLSCHVLCVGVITLNECVSLSEFPLILSLVWF